MSDTELLNAINTKEQQNNERFKELSKKFQYFEKELKRTGVTLQLLWDEYSETQPDGYKYSQFCHHYTHWHKNQKISMRQEHKAGAKMFVDYAGKKMQIFDTVLGKMRDCELFLSILGASQYAYIEASDSQKKHDWINVNQNALRFYGGSTAAIVPDCLKSAVTKSDKYEPEINQTYSDFAEHYQTVILPARALHPQDKSLVENLVNNAYTQILAPLRNQTFYSIEELNEALWKQLDTFNKKNFKNREYSRFQLFEDIEKSQLKALPAENYEIKEFCICKVQYNHHIYLKEDKHYYSAPYQLTGKKVHVIYTSRDVEIYFNNKRMASFLRNRRPYQYTTKDEHRPTNHKYVAQWNSERFIKWGRSISPEVEQVLTHILDSRPHPEQAYKSCMGVLGLHKKHLHDDYIKACSKALETNNISYMFIKNILVTKAFNIADEQELPFSPQLPGHDNIRGKQEYK